MARIAILGGGIAGLAAAYELEQQRKAGKPLDWHLFEASNRFGGTVQTTRRETPDGVYILEGGPDAWVTDKTWARDLAEELGLGDEIIASNEAGKKTYVWLNGGLVAMPDRMRMMVPEDLSTLDASALFSASAKHAFAEELARAEELKSTVPEEDESVANFVRRHFGEEVLEKIGAPLLSGVFGGDTARLSVRSVMAVFVKMEAEHGSLIAALQARKRERGDKPPQPTFTTLRRGMGSLVAAVVSALPQDRLHRHSAVQALQRTPERGWLLTTRVGGVGEASHDTSTDPFDVVLLATPVDVTRELLRPVDPDTAALIPAHASSALLATFCWPRETASTFTVPPGFGFLVPQPIAESGVPEPEDELIAIHGHPQLLAGTFTDQKFPDRTPKGARAVRVFFGGRIADKLDNKSDDFIAAEAFRELGLVLPDLPAPEPSLTTVSRWPRSLPQYEVGHLTRMQDLDSRVGTLGNLYLLGNGYRGVGVPDLIRDARAAACRIAEQTC